MKNKEKYLEEFVRKSMIEKNGGIDFMKEHGIGDYFNDDKLMIDYVGKLLAWLEEECQEPILDEKEKEYLSAVIRPWRNKVIAIRKTKECEISKKNAEFIRIRLDDIGTVTDLPYFKAGTMYKGMELDREYSLEELGI